VAYYLLQKFLVHESLPNVDIEFPGLPRDRSIRVYSDVEQVTRHLTDPRFELVSDVDEADIVWTKHYLKDFKSVIIRICLSNSYWICYFTPVGVRSIVISLPACLSAGISQKNTCKFHQIFSAGYSWPWLCPVMEMQYVMYFQFCGWRHVFIQWKYTWTRSKLTCMFRLLRRVAAPGQSLPSDCILLHSTRM